MARGFLTASTQHYAAGEAVLTTFPVSMAIWFRPANVTSNYTLMSILDSGGSSADGIYIQIQGAVAGDFVNAVSAAGGAFSTAASTAGYTANNWHHACAVWAAANSRTIYLDGGNNATNTTNRAWSSPAETFISRFRDTGNQYYTGDSCEAAIWDVALTAADAAALARGCSPLFVQPANLVRYWPLIGNLEPEPSLVGGNAMVGANTPTKAAHARIYMPSQQIVVPFADAGAGGVFNPYYYRHLAGGLSV